MNKLKHTFFCGDFESTRLSEEESRHAIKVLRMKEGDQFIAVDGKGRKAVCDVSKAETKCLEFVIQSEERHEPRQSGIVQIAIAPTKNIDRFGFFIEKAVELGADRISPIVCGNSERTSLNHEKMAKKLIGSLKQSGNPFLPILDELQSIKDFLKSDYSREGRYIAHCEQEANKTNLEDVLETEKNAVILIGPEGDFREEEINLAKESGFVPVSLGDLTLRTETAGIIACHTARNMFGY